MKFHTPGPYNHPQNLSLFANNKHATVCVLITLVVGLVRASVKPPSFLFIYQYSYETLLKIEQCLQNFLHPRHTDTPQYSYTTGLCPQYLPFTYISLYSTGKQGSSSWQRWVWPVRKKLQRCTCLFLIIPFSFIVAPNKAWEIEWVKKLKIDKFEIYCF